MGDTGVRELTTLARETVTWSMGYGWVVDRKEVGQSTRDRVIIEPVTVGILERRSRSRQRGHMMSWSHLGVATGAGCWRREVGGG